MNNIFKNAYFGKPYKMRNERKALFLRKLSNDSNCVIMLIESDFDFKRIYVYLNGESAYDKNRDVISEWQEEIDEKELNELAEEYMTEEKRSIIKGACDLSFYDLETAYKAGYRKAKEL